MSNTTEENCETVSQVLGPLQLQWIEALESGKFEQGQACLKKDNKFCCLGVACELSGITAIPATCYGVVRYEYLGERYYLPQEIVDKLKFRGNQGDAFGEPTMAIALLNDEGKTFKEIAAIIRENPSQYFTASA